MTTSAIDAPSGYVSGGIYDPPQAVRCTVLEQAEVLSEQWAAA